MRKSTPMPHWIMRNKRANSPIFVLDGPWNPEVLLRGECIMVKVDCPEAIDYISRLVSSPTKIEGFIWEDKNASIESININPEWGKIPVILRIGRIGRFAEVSNKLKIIRSLGIKVLLYANSPTTYRDIQILASLGISTGLYFEEDMPVSEGIKDLVAYAFYSPIDHGVIEPFHTMELLYCGENYVSPKDASYDDSPRYIHINEKLEMAVSAKNLKEGNFIGKGQQVLYDIFHSNEKKQTEWQNFFIQSHPCSFCPAFRVCMGFFSEANCDESHKSLMMDILAGIEHTKQIKNSRDHGNHNIQGDRSL